MDFSGILDSTKPFLGLEIGVQFLLMISRGSIQLWSFPLVENQYLLVTIKSWQDYINYSATGYPTKHDGCE